MVKDTRCMLYCCLAGLYIKSGLKSIGCVFLMTDAQVAEERFLVLINDLLASGEIPELLADDETENLINGVRGEVRPKKQENKHHPTIFEPIFELAQLKDMVESRLSSII